ncbi:hypothetical protein [Parapedobacter lycopersici]|uniref:hypothetical protein n=1 Tax=Parapedobacter lycopersici TaxID=1864939 RepID=UPI00333EA188
MKRTLRPFLRELGFVDNVVHFMYNMIPLHLEGLFELWASGAIARIVAMRLMGYFRLSLWNRTVGG